MKKQAVWIGIILGLFVLGFYQPAQAEDPEKEARAAFANLVKAAKANNQAEFKSYIVQMVKEKGQWKFGKPGKE
jgi:predicted negative regulator of RcsB-dependent stress response